MNAKNQLNKIKTLLGLEVKLEIMKLDNGVELEASAFEAGAEVFIVNGEERVALPAGDYTLEDTRILVVIEEGIIAEIKEEAPAEAPTEEMPAEEAAPEVEVEAEAQTAAPKKVIESITKEMFFSEIEALRSEIAALKTELSATATTEEVVELSEVKEIEVELSATEEAKPLKHNPEGQVAKKELNLYANKKSNTTKDVVFGKIFK
jgi:hypothetical protein